MRIATATDGELRAALDRIDAIRPASAAQEERLSRRAEAIERELEERESAGPPELTRDVYDHLDNVTLAGDYGSEYQ
jgi:hypothetical protein